MHAKTIAHPPARRIPSVLLLLLLTASLGAQTVDLSDLGPGTRSLAGQWKFTETGSG